jgi:hypothetical protein
MNRLFIVLLSVVLSVAVLYDYGHAGGSGLKCGTRIASIGMRQDEVLAICGDPNWTRSWEESHESGSVLRNKDFYRSAVIVYVEEWTYNFGPTRFIQFLLFKNGILVNIESGRYGY